MSMRNACRPTAGTTPGSVTRRPARLPDRPCRALRSGMPAAAPGGGFRKPVAAPTNAPRADTVDSAFDNAGTTVEQHGIIERPRARLPAAFAVVPAAALRG